MSRIILVGKAASGKDHLRKKLESKGFRYGISYTTRPPRPEEKDGIDYYFLSDDEFNSMIEKNEWHEWVSFNGWKYGTTKNQFEEDHLFIMTPVGISHLSEDDRKQSFIIYLDIDQDKRRNRLNSRLMPGDSVDRRIIADEEDFKNFNDFDLRITNDNF